MFHVLNWSPADRAPGHEAIALGNWRKLWGLENVTATMAGSAQENVTFPWITVRVKTDREGEREGRS